MAENRWSPFDPEWYKMAFDKFISTAEQLFNQNDIIAQGFTLPDADGTRSSAFRKDAILNNSFNEEKLRETLKDIYLNSSHKLVASNHDNVHFFKWNGTINDASIVPNTNYCDIILPTDSLIDPSLRDRFKLSQFYRKWVTDTELANNWSVFKWMLLLFINKRIHSSYMIRMDDQLTTLRFEYKSFWMKNDYPVYVVKFDTLYQSRVKISSELVNNQWDWKIPVSEYFNDDKILTQPKVMVAFNKISDSSLRDDGKSNIDPMGDNLEFLEVKDGVIDISNISEYNKDLILSEYREYLWMTIMVPKFMHEFPIPLATDVIYRPYYGKYTKVWVKSNGEYKGAKAESDIGNNKTVYINLDEKSADWNDGWKSIIRPMVLSDAFDTQSIDMYEDVLSSLDDINDKTSEAADAVERLQLYHTLSNLEIIECADALLDKMNILYTSYNQFLESRNIDPDSTYDINMALLSEEIDKIKTELKNYEGFSSQFGHGKNFWELCSDILKTPREMNDRYSIAYLLKNISDTTVWEDELKNIRRFKRPIDPTDIWTFEYDENNKVWRPCILKITRHFPDVYLFNEDEDIENPKIYKALFFYSDTMNVRELSSPITRPTASWDKDMEEFMYDTGADYRDIFMEKFYWMGISSIYKGLIKTKYRWEVIEYVNDNESYSRFNELFLNTMDPYFKMGLATYLKSPNFEFPFDESVSKLNESINEKFIGYQKITNYEMYLNKTWIPSYFDYVLNIFDDWDGSERLLKRPDSNFDTTRLLKKLYLIQSSIKNEITELKIKINKSLEDINAGKYLYDQTILNDLLDKVDELDENCDNLIEFIENLDIDIYSVDDVNTMVDKLNKHLELVEVIEENLDNAYNEAIEMRELNESKKNKYNDINLAIVEIHNQLDGLEEEYVEFDVEHFMYGVNNPEFFDDIDHYDDSSLIGIINTFKDLWDGDLIVARTKLYQSTVLLWGNYENPKSYSLDEINTILESCQEVYNDIINLRILVYREWGYDDPYAYVGHDETLIAKFDFAENYIKDHIDNLIKYIERLNAIIQYRDEILSKINEFDSEDLNDNEKAWMDNIENNLSDIITNISFLDLDNHLTDIMSEYIEISDGISEWDQSLIKENDVIEYILSYTTKPTDFIEGMNSYKNTLEAMIMYMNTCSSDFISYVSLPTYSDIFKVDDIELVSGGFGHKQDEKVYIPSVGTYLITAVDDTVGAATNLIPDTSDKNLSYTDPLVEDKEYYSTTNGEGMGIIVKVKEVSHLNVINDNVCTEFIDRMKNVLKCIKRDKDVINPYNNASVKETINTIENINIGWDYLKSVYSNYITAEMSDAVQISVDICTSFIELLNILISDRNKVDLQGCINGINDFIINTYKTYQSYSRITANYIYFDNRLRTVYADLAEFFGNGSEWNDKDELVEILNNVKYELNLFKRFVIEKYKLDNEYDRLIAEWTAVDESIDYIINNIGITITDELNQKVEELEGSLSNIPDPVEDNWYKLDSLNVSSEGNGYLVGDIISVNHNVDYPIYIQITNISDEGAVTGIRLLMNYAIPYQLYGVYSTTAVVGSGTGLIVAIVSSMVDEDDSTYLLDKDSDKQSTNKYGDNDLFMFTFPNSYDLPIDYEVFIGGHQVSNFITRHDTDKTRSGLVDTDTIYINANKVNNLKNSSIIKEREHYLVYKIDGFGVVDGGKGYSEGQEIFVNSDEAPIRLQVSELEDTPFGTIKSVDLVDNYTTFKGLDPYTEEASIVEDSLNNIDDEYNEGYYDKLTSEGIIKPADRDLDPEEYPFKSERFDELENGLRNKDFMYGDIDMPDTEDAATDGDPDYHNYLGSRIDNSQIPMVDDRRWDGIDKVIPTIDPIIPDINRTPPNQPVKGEYQLIDRIKIHNSEADILTNIPIRRLQDILNESYVPESGSYQDNDIIIDPVDTDPIIDGQDVEPTPTVVVHGNTIKPLDTSRIRALIYGEIEASDNPPYYMDPCLVNTDATSESDLPTINYAMEPVDVEVDTYAELPKHINEWNDVNIGDRIIVEKDESNDGHRMMYTVHSFTVTGYIIYDDPEIADYKWDHFSVNWMDTNFYPDIPCLKAQYPDEDWDNLSLMEMKRKISQGKVDRKYFPKASNKTYIDSLTINDISVYNHTLQRWEDLTDPKWTLQVNNEEGKYGFVLTYNEEGYHCYDMALYLNKIPDTQIRNSTLKENAKVRINSFISDEVNNDKRIISVNTSRLLRIRKLFPYEQKESYSINNGESMLFKLAKYIHYKNELHLEDISIYNKTAGRFENVLDPTMFEVSFKDNKNISNDYETYTEIVQCLITDPGDGFIDGNAWAINTEHSIQIFGKVTTNDGKILSFIPLHCPNAPSKDISLQFKIYQHSIQWNTSPAKLIVEFHLYHKNVSEDGYIHNVSNPLAPLPNEFKITPMYDIDSKMEYDVRIIKNPMKWTFSKDHFEMFPTFHIPDLWVPKEHLYILVEEGRLPLVNQSTGRPTFDVLYTDDGMDIKYLNMYNKYEKLEIHYVPYHMRSVYIQRIIPSNGYIDLNGKLNKPLNKKYFEFWVNGKLLDNEVTIITPTKLFLHGLTSLKNFEIIELERDQSEYFGDNFLTYNSTLEGRPYPTWNLNTYLDDVLEGNLEGDNYTTDEQGMLLTPVWKQVEIDHPEYKNYPQNIDIDNDILLRSGGSTEEGIPYQFAVIEPPTIEGVMLNNRNISFEDFKFIPMTDEEITNLTNEEWKEEIDSGLLPSQSVISDDEWYGILARLYNEYGEVVHNLDESAYRICDNNTLKINTSNKFGRIIKNNPDFNLE